MNALVEMKEYLKLIFDIDGECEFLGNTKANIKNKNDNNLIYMSAFLLSDSARGDFIIMLGKKDDINNKNDI